MFNELVANCCLRAQLSAPPQLGPRQLGWVPGWEPGPRKCLAGTGSSGRSGPQRQLVCAEAGLAHPARGAQSGAQGQAPHFGHWGLVFQGWVARAAALAYVQERKQA